MPDTPTDTSSSPMEVDNNEFGSQARPYFNHYRPGYHSHLGLVF